MIEIIALTLLIFFIIGVVSYCEYEDKSQIDAESKIAAVKAEIAASKKRCDMMKEWMK